MCTRKKFQRVYSSMPSAGLELTKLTYTRLKNNLISLRGDRSTTLRSTTNSPKLSDVSNMLYYCLVKKSRKKTIAALVMIVCVRVVGLRVPSSCCGSPWPPHRLSSLIKMKPARSQRALVDTQFQLVHILPRPKKKNAPRRLRCLS